MFAWFKKKQSNIETRASGSGFTAAVMSARESYVSGRSGLAELTAAAQSCVSLWEGGMALADVEGSDILTPSLMGLAGRALALRGEAVFLIRDTRLVPCNDWDLRTRDGRPRAYRVSVSEAGGGRTETALAGEVLHFRAGSDVVAPWAGTAPLRRSQLSSAMLEAVEAALGEVYREAPIGSQIVPFPEAPDTDMDALARDFRGRRGRVLMRESVNVAAAGGPAPTTDWRPAGITPDIEKALPIEALQAARSGVFTAYGVLPSLFADAAQGPLVREAQRHLAQWTLQPLAALMAEEASDKLGTAVAIDTLRPLQAYDAGGRARAVSALVKALGEAKAAGIDPGLAFNLADWKTE